MSMNLDTQTLSVQEIFDEILNIYCAGGIQEGEWLASPDHVKNIFAEECVKHGYTIAQYINLADDLVEECAGHYDKMVAKYRD